jgi:putative ABC transport system substrate-binding protein
MDRRAFLGLAAAGVVAAPGIAHAQQPGKLHRIGFLALFSGPVPQVEAFRQQLHELGYVEGRNLVIEYRFAAGKAELLPEMAAELVRLKVEVIVGAATPVIAAAMRVTSAIPIVMAAAADPVRSGLVASLAHPGGNVTGSTLLSNELAGKRLQLLREVVPKAARVAVLANPGFATPALLEEMRTAARQLGIQILAQEVRAAADLAGAFAAMERERAQALIVQVSPFSIDNAQRIVDLAAERRLPAMYELRGFVDVGGLVSYGPSIPELYRRAAIYVDKILRGAKPADLPVEQPTKFELVINMKAAKALGLTIPPAILARADEVIQ